MPYMMTNVSCIYICYFILILGKKCVQVTSACNYKHMPAPSCTMQSLANCGGCASLACGEPLHYALQCHKKIAITEHIHSFKFYLFHECPSGGGWPWSQHQLMEGFLWGLIPSLLVGQPLHCTSHLHLNS